MATFTPFPPTCQCIPVECPAVFTDGSCDPAAICVGTNTPCKPTSGGRGIPIPGAAAALGATTDSVSNTDPASAPELLTGFVLVAAAVAAYEREPVATLLLALGLVALAALAYATGAAAIPWWVWIAAAFAVLMRVLGSNGAELLTNTTLANSLLL